MATINKYLLENYSSTFTLDPTVELMTLLSTSDYNNILNHIIRRYGEISNGHKVLDFPDLKKCVNIKYAKENDFMSFEFKKDNEVYDYRCVFLLKAEDLSETK